MNEAIQRSVGKAILMSKCTGVIAHCPYSGATVHILLRECSCNWFHTGVIRLACNQFTVGLLTRQRYLPRNPRCRRLLVPGESPSGFCQAFQLVDKKRHTGYAGTNDPSPMLYHVHQEWDYTTLCINIVQGYRTSTCA